MTNKKRILFIEPCYVDFGGYIRAIGLARAMSQRGYHVDLLVSSPRKFDLRIRKTKINENLWQYELPRIQINHFLTGRIMRGIIATFFVLFKKYYIIHSFTIVQMESNIPFLLATMLKKRIVVDWDDYWTDAHIHVPAYNNPLVRAYLKFCEYHLQKLSKNATATSDFLMKELEKIGIKNRLKIINGIYEEQFTPMERREARTRLGLPDDKKIILTFGNTFFRERTIYLFRVFEKINLMDSTIDLYFNNDPKKIIKEQAKGEKFRSEMFSKITNIGYLDKEKLSLYLGAADCILFTMGDSTLEKACFPTRLGTFINGGVPIMTNNTDTEACRILRKHECAIIGSSLDDLANRVVSFLNNPQKQREIREKMKKAKKDLAWNTLGGVLASFYERL